MPRNFRLTCARTTYFDLDLAAETAAEAELLLDAALAADPALADSGRPLGKPLTRVVEIAAAEETESGLGHAAT